MYRIPGVLSPATTSAQAVPRVRPTRGPPAAPDDGGATGLAGTVPGQAEDRERIAAGSNDVVVRRLLAAGLDLQDALGLLGDHPASAKICHARDELDQAIRDIREAVSRAWDTA
ncbi:MAG TPA: hypothetical protein VN767_00490 [Streptosporangiaceae bacterium]|jgi:hypothetical protein|nr:hypothetical protein [Streptosporangiaceae bacterium]